ncbi:DUF4328 domain-containing protein [Mycolicibacterium sp. P1-18]|uniref:DUF4328 domain-containing protein n=1 Tax=Mycolicibacterium sp. P1-18 TaxID=2024615 RepID=UPI0011F257A4|nr:DUF4328 domain-containing protein [Mycolicibacterium sp. P1-18]KAA0099998.1 DUF4328 domain-containing protein [Mycolicibacterium sp. P1-18]
MIQVCSRCGTRWNVRDRQRVWCPRCQGSLLPPSAEQAPPGPAGPSQRLPAGYRWIAVRPGAPPPARRTNPPLGPTPRYAVIPRWGLQDRFEPPAPATPDQPPKSATRMVQATVAVTMLALAFAVVVHIANYALLLYNRSRLLNPIVAGVATWAGVAASVLVFFALIATTVVLTNWLVVRRASTYAHFGVEDPRPAWQLWVCCLVPLVNLFWAPVFVLELARVEGRLSWLRTPIVVWWCAWWVSFLVSAFSFATSFTSDSQGIANNTVAVTIAYLAALAALLLTVRMYQGFEHQTVDQRPTKRWVVVADDTPKDAEPRDREADDASRAESDRMEPAASGIIST